MLRPRNPLHASSTLGLLISPPLPLQIRCKTTSKMYKGTFPKKPKKPAPSAPTRPPHLQNAKKTENQVPRKPPKDPLQGLRESREEERMLKFQPRPAGAEPKPARMIIERKPPVERKHEPVVAKTEEKSAESETQSPIEQESASESTSPSTESSGTGMDPSNMPLPKSDPRPIPPAGPQTDRRILYFSAAAVLFLVGVILYRQSIAPAHPPIVLARDSPDHDKTAPKTKDLSAPLVSSRRGANVTKAIEVLQNVFEERCSTSIEDLVDFEGQGTLGLGEGRLPKAVVWPTTTEEVEVILKVAETYRVPVIPYSGGTSLEGQCVPTSDCITISLAKMDKIIAFRPRDMDITLQPGISWTDLNAFLKPYNLFLPIDPGPNAHIGGMIATSASGTNAVKYGTMKDWILNLTVVLPGGHALKTRSRARKSSTGYDLTKLFCGSEGTLGVITEVTLKLAHLPEKEVVGAIAFDSNYAAANAVTKLMGAGIEPRCVELLDTTCITAVNASLPPSVSPFPLKPHLFFKLSGSHTTIPAQQKSLVQVLRSSGGHDLRLARNDTEATQIWDIRKGLLYSLLAQFPGSDVIGTDVCVPVSRLAGLIEQYKVDQDRINEEIEVPQFGEKKVLTSLVLGHVGDGNFHSLIAFEKGNEELKKKAKELENTLVMNALALDGTASGEHGVGIHKIVLSCRLPSLILQGFMDAEYDPVALALMHAIKNGVDPHGIMNPGTLLPPLNGQPLPRISTIDLEKLTEWVVKPHSLTDPAEKDPDLQNMAVTTRGDSWMTQAWNQMKRWGGEIKRLSIGTEPHAHEATSEDLLEVWVEQGDGV